MKQLIYIVMMLMFITSATAISQCVFPGGITISKEEVYSVTEDIIVDVILNLEQGEDAGIPVRTSLTYPGEETIYGPLVSTDFDGVAIGKVKDFDKAVEDYKPELHEECPDIVKTFARLNSTVNSIDFKYVTKKLETNTKAKLKKCYSINRVL